MNPLFYSNRLHILLIRFSGSLNSVTRLRPIEKRRDTFFFGALEWFSGATRLLFRTCFLFDVPYRRYRYLLVTIKLHVFPSFFLHIVFYDF